MKRIQFILFLLLTFGCMNAFAQDTKKIDKEKEKLGLFEEEKFSNELSKKYAGKIVFANSEIEREDPESNYIRTYTLGDKLYIRGYFNNSVSNSMLIQLLESGKKQRI